MRRFAFWPGLRRFARDRRGVTAVEFALISVPLMLFMFGLIELCLILLVTATLDTATDFAARNIRTGVFQKSGAITNADFAGLVCRNMNWLRSMCEGDPDPETGQPRQRLYVEAKTFANFAAPGALPFSSQQRFQSNSLCWNVGNPGDIVMVRTYFDWPIITPLLRPIFVTDGDARRLVSIRLFRNEPYDASLQPVGDDGCTP